MFDLKGYKLRGRWTLVKIKKSEKDWLFIKERDVWAKTEPESFPEESVLSGLTVEELGAGHTPAGRIREELDRLKVPTRRVDPATVEFMLAEPRDEAFNKPGWVFEPKLDGYRALATHDGGAPALKSRNGNDLTPSFPDVARAVRALPVARAVIDGELVIPDSQGKPSFQALQKRARLSRALDIRRAAAESPAVFYAFDLLGFEDRDLRALPLTERKRILRMLLPPLGPIRFVDHFERDGVALMQHVGGLGLEGIVGKKADTPYKGGRTSNWVKIRVEQTADFAVVGFTEPRGSRGGFGALQLGDWVEGELVYAGRAGKRLQRQTAGPGANGARGSEAKDPTVQRPATLADREEAAGQAPHSRREGHQLGGAEGGVRGSIQGMDRGRLASATCVPPVPRMTRTRTACVRQGAEETGAPEAADDPPPPKVVARPPEVALSNLKKVFWPVEKYTKGDLIEYYRGISPWLLPYLKDRPRC